MVIAHAELSPGHVYTITEHSSALDPDAERKTMADVVAIFVFGHH
jgi:hypothetical protein